MVAAVHLGPAGDARAHDEAPPALLGHVKHVLEYERPRPDQRHFAPYHVPQLEKLVDAQPAHPRTGRREALVGRSDVPFSVHAIAHGAQLEEPERHEAAPQTRLTEDEGTTGIRQQRQHGEEQERAREQQGQSRHGGVRDCTEADPPGGLDRDGRLHRWYRCGRRDTEQAVREADGNSFRVGHFLHHLQSAAVQSARIARHENALRRLATQPQQREHASRIGESAEHRQPTETTTGVDAVVENADDIPATSRSVREPVREGRGQRTGSHEQDRPAPYRVRPRGVAGPPRPERVEHAGQQPSEVESEQQQDERQPRQPDEPVVQEHEEHHAGAREARAHDQKAEGGATDVSPDEVVSSEAEGDHMGNAEHDDAVHGEVGYAVCRQLEVGCGEHDAPEYAQGHHTVVRGDDPSSREATRSMPQQIHGAHWCRPCGIRRTIAAVTT
ncbi:hypothetical protein HRbin39_00178 [bacterium HR39]|nr:hypothetical protein HRbin39_00178 [bacterium HR39]